MKGYLAVRPDASANEVSTRFIYGSGVRPGIDIRKAVSSKTWEQQQEQFAEILLTSLFALYESWLTAVLEDLGPQSKELIKQLQFPTVQMGGTSKGVWGAVDKITKPESSFAKGAFYVGLTQGQKYAKTELDNLLFCYRYFKECRNALIHSGGRTDQKLVDAYGAFQAVATPAKLGLREVPLHDPVSLGTPVRIHLRGAVGMVEVILRMLVTLDAELSRAKKFEEELSSRWIEVYGSNRKLKAKTDKRHRQLEIMIAGLGLPKPPLISEIDKYLLSRQVISLENY
jgi:hypothetical protein